MAVRDFKDVNTDEIYSELSKFGKIGKKIKILIEFLYQPIILDIVNEMNSEFDSKEGNKAYNRMELLLILLICFHEKYESWSKIEKELKTNKIFDTILGDKKPCTETLKNFLKENSRELFKIMFIATLIAYNDEELLNFVRIFIDGTSAIVHGSKYYNISDKEVKMMDYIKEWGLEHINTPTSITRTKNGLKLKLKYYENDEKMVELINLALNRIQIYNRKLIRRRNEFKEVMEERNIDCVSIVFPRAVMMKTKKEIFDYGLNLQVAMNKDFIILTSLLIEKSNDTEALEEVIVDLRETFILLKEYQKKYGNRENYTEIEKALDTAIWICDSGYFTLENLKVAEESKYNFIILSKTLAYEINKELKEQLGLISDKHDYDKKITKRDLIRINADYICPNGNRIVLKDKIPVKHKDINERAPHECKYRCVYVCDDCEGCSYQDHCKFQHFEVRTELLKHTMISKVANKTHKNIYGERFSSNEFINGYFKGKKGILYLLSSNVDMANKEIILQSIVYNVIHFPKLREKRDLEQI